MPIISVRDLVVEYDGRRVLNGLNLDIERGDFVSLMGPSGSGKSTLLNLLAGIDRPNDGTIRIAGEEILREVGSIDRHGVIVKRVIGAHDWNSPANRALVERLLAESGT